MDAFFALLGRLIQDEQMLGTVFIGATTLAVFALGLAVLFIFSSALDPLRSRISGLTEKRSAARLSTGAIARRMDPIAPYVLPQSQSERTGVARRLAHAGFRSPNAVVVFYAIKTILAVIFPLLALPALLWLGDLKPLAILTAILGLNGIGLLAPTVILERMVQNRMRLVRNGLPDALDLLVVCTEAGLGLKAAIQRVARELAVSHPELAEELAVVTAETRAGLDANTALHNLADRTGLEDIRGLVTLLSQSIRFGTSIADALRVYANEFRDKRMQKAEEEAAKIGTKMIFPLVLCLFPSFFVVVVGPAIIGVVRVLQGV